MNKKLKLKDEYKGMTLSRFNLEMGLKITFHPDTKAKYYQNFQDKGFDIFEEIRPANYIDPTIIGLDKIISGSRADYSVQSGAKSYTWYIEGGTILGGQGTDEIVVLWDEYERGQIFNVSVDIELQDLPKKKCRTAKKQAD